MTEELTGSDWKEVRTQVAAMRATKTDGLRQAARLVGIELPEQTAVDARMYALTHHFAYAITDAVSSGRTGDADSLASGWLRAYEKPGVELIAGHPVTVTDRKTCTERIDNKYESPLYLCLVDTETLSPDDADAARWIEAGSFVVSSGLQWIIESALGAVVTLDRRGRKDTTQSYTLKALPGSIFIDSVDDPVRLGELLVHESAHALLNDVFNAFDVRLSSESRWYSPWKGVHRPAYGLLHAGFAFGVLQRYFQYFAYEAPTISPYARIRAETGAEQWDAARASVTDALQEVDRAPVEELLRGFLS